MLQSYYLRNTSFQRFYFSTVATPKGFVQLKCRFDHLWTIGTQESEIRIDDVMLPQSVITSRLKYLNSRNSFFKEMNNFSMAKTNSQFYQQALYDLLRMEETHKHQGSINVTPEYLQLQGFQIQLPIDELQMTATKFQFQIQSTTYSIGFLSTVIAQISTLGEQFQDIAFVNVANNLKKLLLTKIRRNQNIMRKIQEIFETFAKVFERNDYLSQSQPQHISSILGDLNEIMITYHIELTPEFQKSYAKSAQSFVNKYAEMQHNTISLKLNIVDYKNMIYTILLAEQKPEAITSAIINEIANCGIEYGHLAQIIELMSMLLLYKIPCTELFLKKIQLQQQKKGKFTVIQLFIIIKSFEQAQVPLNEFSHFLFNEMLQFVYQDKQLVEFNQVLMMARVLKDIFQSSFITSRQSIEKRNDKIIPYFEKLINRFPQQANFNNVLFIANTINQQLKSPNFLIDLLHVKMSEIEINSQTISLYKEFLEITHNFYRQKFQYFQRNDSREKGNSLPSTKYSELIQIIMTKLIDEHLDLEDIDMYTHMIKIMHISYFQISLPKATQFFETVFKIPTIYQHIDIITRAMLIQQIQFEQFPQIQEIINQNLETNNFLESYYNLLEGLGKESRNQMQNIDILKNAIIQLIDKNADFLVTERIVENVIHTFPSFIQLHTFENYQFILPIIDMLDINLPDKTINLLQLQLNKMIKSFDGNILIKNLLLFNKYKIFNYDTFLKAAENIPTCFFFNREIGSLERNGLLASDDFVYQLVQAYLFQIEQASYVASENVKIISYLGSVIFDRLNHNELLLLCKMLGKNKNLYYPELLTQLKKIKVQFPSILEFTSMFTIFNPNIRQALQKYLKLHPPQTLSAELMQSLTNNCISLPNINVLFNKLSEQHKITLLPSILEYLINCWDCVENIDDILNFTHQNINHINLQEKCSFVILNVLRKAMKYTQITNEMGYFKVNFNKTLFQLEDEEIQQYQQILETHELLPNTHQYDGKSIPYYPSMTLEYDPNKLATWKIYLTDQSIFNDRGKLMNFLLINPDFEKQSVLHTISEFLGNLNLNDQLPISSYLTAIPKMNLEQKISLLKSDEDFLSFMICFTLAVPMNNQQIQYDYQTQVNQIDQIENIHIMIKQKNGEKKSCLKIQYASQLELIKNNEKSYLSPLLILKAMKLSDSDSIYYINFDEWIKLNPSRKKQSDFVQSLIDEL